MGAFEAQGTLTEGQILAPDISPVSAFRALPPGADGDRRSGPRPVADPEDLRGAYRIEEDGAFAWVPTLTQITRQSIFAGQPPLFFARTIRHTAAESGHWSRLWIDRRLKKEEIFYVALQGKKEETGEVEGRLLAAAAHPQCRMLGAELGTVDQNMHQTDMDTAWMHSMVRNWARSGGPQKILDRLLEQGFEVYLTADHGNVWGRASASPMSAPRQRSAASAPTSSTPS